MEFTNNNYYDELERCKEELKALVNMDINTINLMLDNPIYPNNEELYNAFCDDKGFAEVEFLVYLVKLNNYTIDYRDCEEYIIR